MNQPQNQGPTQSFDFNYPTIVSILYILSSFTGVTGIIGIILAYVWRGENPGGWEASHYTYHIRTFWIGLVASIAGIVLLIIGIGFLILAAIGIWVIIRSVVSLLKAQKHEAIADPETLWI
jgi:uncharacterized membrane protein